MPPAFPVASRMAATQDRDYSTIRDATGLPVELTLAVKMFLQPYSPDELTSLLLQVYLRWRTHRDEAVITVRKADKTSLSPVR